VILAIGASPTAISRIENAIHAIETYTSYGKVEEVVMIGAACVDVKQL